MYQKYFLLLLLTLVACVPKASTEQSGALTPLADKTPSSSGISLTEIPTATAPALIPTPKLPSFTQQCAQNALLNGLNGSIVLYQSDSKDGSDGVQNRYNYDRLFLYQGKQGTATALTLEGEYQVPVGVSSDGKRFLYSYPYHDYSMFVVLDSTGRMQTTFDDFIDGEIAWRVHWLSLDELRIKTSDENLLVYNIDTQQIKRFKKAFPGLYKQRRSDYTNPDWRLDGEFEDIYLVYSPDQTRVLYAKEGEIIDLVDMQNEQVLLEKNVPAWGRLPRWSSNSEKLAIIINQGENPGQEEFYLLSKEGKFERLTFLTHSFSTVHILQYTWSQDGTKIAFWLNTETQEPKTIGLSSRLAILNVQDGSVVDTCQLGISVPYYRTDYSPDEIEHDIYWVAPVWSPDGSKIAFVQRSNADATVFDVVVLDWAEQKVMSIARNMQPIGWMLPVP